MKINGVLVLAFLLMIWEPHFVYAAQEEQVAEIKRWQDGYAYDDKDNQIKDTWAIDNNVFEGKYVCFDAVGNVLVRADEILTDRDFSSYASDTELDKGMVALRTEYVEGFNGVIYLIFTNSNGGQVVYEIDEEMEYMRNIHLASNTYVLIGVTRNEGSEQEYKVEVSPGEFTISNNGFLVVNIIVREGESDIDISNALSSFFASKEADETEDESRYALQEDEGEEAKKEKSPNADFAVENFILMITVLISAMVCIVWWFKKKERGGK